MDNRNVPNPNHKPWTHISNIPIPIFLRLIQRKNSTQNAQSQEPTIKQRKWTKEDYENYENFQQAEHERELESINRKHERAKKLKEFKAELEAESQKNALQRYEQAFEHASQYGEIISFEYDDKKGRSTVVYKADDE
jgi:monoamine oxidase